MRRRSGPLQFIPSEPSEPPRVHILTNSRQQTGIISSARLIIRISEVEKEKQRGRLVGAEKKAT